MQVINMLPYDIHVYETNSIKQGPMFSYPKTGKVSRVVAVDLGSVRGPELWYESVSYRGLELFPDPEAGTFYIVSLVAAIAARNRGDLLSPYYKIRNNSNEIIGCKHLQKVI